MKLTKYDTPFQMKRPAQETVETHRRRDPSSVKGKCRAWGIAHKYEAIITRMRRLDMTFEEAVAHDPRSKTEIGQAGRAESSWDHDGVWKKSEE